MIIFSLSMFQTPESESKFVNISAKSRQRTDTIPWCEVSAYEAGTFLYEKTEFESPMLLSRLDPTRFFCAYGNFLRRR